MLADRGFSLLVVKIIFQCVNQIVKKRTRKKALNSPPSKPLSNRTCKI